MNPNSAPPAARAFVSAVVDDAGIEREVREESLLGGEIGSTGGIQSHFLTQLPHHCTMLVVALADAYASLLSLGPGRPFGSSAVARGLLETAADLYWLSRRSVDARERARRAITVYLTQTEATIRQLKQLRDRTSVGSLDPGIAEGWELLERTADEALRAGYHVTRTKRAGARFVVGSGKPTTSALVEDAVSHFLGTTGVNLYSSLSSIAHAEGSGLGQLINHKDCREVPAGTRYAYGLELEDWAMRYMSPCHAVAVGATSEWLGLAFPERLPRFLDEVLGKSDQAAADI